ncbi:MAG: 2-oxoacid:acceptor oxidoreductase family protein [Methanomicrobiales archaeon]|jgi:2-oxoglutarate ferredoxin oxidoreductase subunit gamma|nr:2-oxoacid:acceptor oxidoreductase family protein [Methanomicrobiales archaeon]
MRTEIRFAGFGGQGIITSAVIFGKAAALYDNKYVVQTQVYGPEARGGAATGAVIIDEVEILYPKVVDPDIYVIMSQDGFDKYGTKTKPDAIMVLDSGLVHDRPNCTYYEVPASRVAKEDLGRVIVANIIMLGALVAATGVIGREALKEGILTSVPKGTEELNMKAMIQGFELIQKI